MSSIDIKCQRIFREEIDKSIQFKQYGIYIEHLLCDIIWICSDDCYEILISISIYFVPSLC